jgi:hypothetical protein
LDYRNYTNKRFRQPPQADCLRRETEEWLMKIAIIGGNGFLGVHLARALVRESHRIVRISNGGFAPAGGDV